MRLIGLMGYARSGKDTVAGYLAEYGFARVAFADKLKEVALAVNPVIDWYGHGVRIRLADVVYAKGWEEAKALSEVRSFLQNLGVALRENIDKDVWVDAAFKPLRYDGSYVITDVRFPNEAKRVKEHSGILVRVSRPGVGPANGHVSETALDDVSADYALSNNGTQDDLKYKARTLLEWAGWL